MSKLERIITFINVVEENGFAATGRKKNISTAAISRQIAALEAELGAELLQRSPHKITLTDIGQQYYQQCKKIISDLNEAESMITGSQSEAVGSLKVVCNLYFAAQYLIPHLPKFMAQNPKLKIHFDLGERFPDLVEENIDILFGVTMEGPPDLVRKRFATTRYVLCASPKYLKKYGVPKVPADLKNHRYITHSQRKPADNVLIFKGGKKIYVEPILWFNGSFALRECALQDMGIVMLNEHMVTDELKNKRLIEVLNEYQEPEKPVYLYYQQSRYLQPKIRKFIDFYTAKLNEKNEL